MAGCIIPMIFTLISCSAVVSVLIHKGYIDKKDRDWIGATCIIVAVCSLLWFIFWPLLMLCIAVYGVHRAVGILLNKPKGKDDV